MPEALGHDCHSSEWGYVSLYGVVARAGRSLATQSFDEIWNGPALSSLRQEFTESHAGVDCLNCTIRRGADDPDDDFFFRKLAKPLPSMASRVLFR